MIKLKICIIAMLFHITILGLDTKQCLPLTELMIPNAAIKNYWQDQERWGEMTAIAIKDAVSKLEKNEITTIMGLYTFLAQQRFDIGHALQHEDDHLMGKKRQLTYFTMIENRTRYRDFFNELHDFINHYYPDINHNKNKLLYHHKYNIKRSTISVIEKTIIDIFHTEPDNFIEIINIIEKLYYKLKTNQDYDQNKIRKTINKIYFYIADAMLSCRGSAAISEMLYHSLEKYFLHSYSYISSSNAYKFSGDKAISLDILAMVSPDFITFNDYFMTYIFKANEHIIIVEQ